MLALESGRFSTLQPVALKGLRDQALRLTAAIAELDGAVERATQNREGDGSLLGIKGIGPRAAAVFLLGIGTVGGFETAGKRAACPGIVPKVSQSNDTDTREPITKRGRKGVYQHCGKKHLHRSAAEFEFRYNNRDANGVDDGERTQAAIKSAVGKRSTGQIPC